MKTMKQIRISKGLSQKELGALAGFTYGTIYKMEAGKPVSIKTALAVCRVLGVELKDVEGVKIATSRV